MPNNRFRYAPTSDEGDAVFFAGANTADGFIGAYGDFIRERECERIFILKGGPGTGKSTLIRACAAHAPADAAVTLLLCSSDPASADAAILTSPDGRRVALLDGTAPHAADPVLPGAAGEIVDLGRFWDGAALTAARREIDRLTEEKARAFGQAYRLLAARRQIARLSRALLEECLLGDKLAAAAARMLRPIPPEETPEEERRFTFALSMRGAVRLPSFAAAARRTVRIRDHGGSAVLFLDAVREEAARRGISARISPLLPDPAQPGEILLPTSGIRFCREEDAPPSGDDAQTVNMLRFLDRGALASRRGRLRFLERCADDLALAALGSLEQARSAHAALEEIYRAAMDFGGVQALTEALACRIRDLLA